MGKRTLLAGVLLTVLVPSLVHAQKLVNDECLTMPKELARFAQSLGMEPISSEFYSNSLGEVDGPPFVYGYFYPFDIAAFWAKKNTPKKESGTYLVVLKRKTGSIHEWELCADCLAPIRAVEGTMGALSIVNEGFERIPGVNAGFRMGKGKLVDSLSVFRTADKEPKYVKKTKVRLGFPPIYSSRDGLVTIYYCIDGEWWAENID